MNNRILPPDTRTVQVEFVQSFEVASKDDLRGHVLLIFNPNTGREKVFAMRDDGAMTMAHQVVRNVTDRRGKGRAIIAPD